MENKNYMKKALLLTGYMRTYKNTYSNIYNNLIKPNNCDIFICTTIRNDEYDITNLSIMDKIIKRDELKKQVKEVFGNELKEIIVSISKTDYEWIYSESIYLSALDHKVKSLYGMAMIENYERENDIKYDYIIISRPDFFFDNVINVDNIVQERSEKDKNKEIYLFAYQKSNGAVTCSDGFAFGNRESMKYYINFCNHYDKIGCNSDKELYCKNNRLIIENLILVYLHYYNVRVISISDIAKWDTNRRGESGYYNRWCNAMGVDSSGKINNMELINFGVKSCLYIRKEYISPLFDVYIH